MARVDGVIAFGVVVAVVQIAQCGDRTTRHLAREGHGLGEATYRR
jgi:hypothetical protein